MYGDLENDIKKILAYAVTLHNVDPGLEDSMNNVISALRKYRNMYYKEYRHHMDHKRYLDRANAQIQELTKEHLAECELLPMNLETKQYGRGWGKTAFRANEFFNYLLSLPENEMRGLVIDHKHVAVTKDKVVPEKHIEETFNTKLTNLKCDSMGSVLRFEFEKLKEEILK